MTAAVSPKFLVTIATKQSAGIDSNSMMAVDIVRQTVDPLSCASFRSSGTICVVRSSPLKFVKKLFRFAFFFDVKK